MPSPEADDLDPEIRQFQQRLAAAYAEHPALDGVDLAAARAITEAVRAPFAQGGPAMASTQQFSLPAGPAWPPLRLRLHRPTALPDPAPALAYLHGGGWVYFSLDTHDRLMRELAARSGRVVVGIDYARAPESRFPVALAQTASALRWLHTHAGEVGIDAARLAVGGDSAGANLALATAMLLRDAGEGTLLQGLLLNYGVFSDDDTGESFARYDGPRYTLGRDEMRVFWQQYLRDDRDRADPRAQPLRGRLHGLPPALLVVAECDVLRDGSLALAQRLAEAGAPPTLHRYAGATHSFLEAMSMSALARRALDESADWLRALPLRAGA